MKLSAAGLEFIAHEEGFVDHEYLCFAGARTIGFGHVIKDGELFPRTISRTEAMALLYADVNSAERAVDRLVHVDLTQNQFDALVSFVFNLGEHAFRQSTLLRYLNDGEYDAAANEFPRWCKARIKGQLTVSETLLRRRKKEAAMFLSDADIA